MPELPEVETVRRGLAPVMEGARFTRVEVRRGDLRWPLSKDFAKRITGATVDGLGRRAKYLIPSEKTLDFYGYLGHNLQKVQSPVNK